MDDWQRCKFSELLQQPVRNGIYKKKEFHGRGAKIINMGELFGFPRLGAVSMKRVELTGSEPERFGVLVDDLLFARRSLVAEGAGKCSIVMDVDEPTTFESSIIRARPDRDRAIALFYYYYFGSPQGLHSLDTIRRHVAVAGITGSDLSELEVPVPTITEQKSISSILGALDDKIELNRRMNETLETMARAIFRDWFVDFGPTRAKAEGRAPYLAPELWDLFPDALDDEGKPVGWEKGVLSDIADFPRRSISPADVSRETPYIGLEHMPRRSIALNDWESAGKVTSNKSVFKKGEFLFGKLRPYFHKVGLVPLDGICSTDIVIVVPRDPEWSAFTLACLSSDEFVNYTDQTSTGTKMPRTSWKTMGKYEICLPSDQVASAFNSVAQRLLDRVSANICETRTLTQTRDLLLPKLMSGEIRLCDAEKAVGAVA